MYFAQKKPIKVEVLRISSAQVKIYQILVIFETINQLFFKFGSLFSVILLCTFLAEILYAFDKRSLSKYKFGEILREQSKVWYFPLWWAPFVQII